MHDVTLHAKTDDGIALDEPTEPTALRRKPGRKPTRPYTPTEPETDWVALIPEQHRRPLKPPSKAIT